MSAELVVRAAPGFAGGRLRLFNRLLMACARAGSPERVTLALDESLLREADLQLRVQNAYGDPLGLPAPHQGIFRDERERAMLAAAIRDMVTPVEGLTRIVNDFLPAPGVSMSEAALTLWPRLIPGLRVRGSTAADTETAAPELAPNVVWLGPHQRRTLHDLGLQPEEMLAQERAQTEMYRPELSGELATVLEESEALWKAQLARLRQLGQEVDASLLGSWSRMDRTVQRGLREFRASAERCLDNHSGIRRARWHQLYQALRPAGEAQEEGYSLLHAAAQLRLQLPLSPEIWERSCRATREWSGNPGQSLFLDS
jgi:hypothetical protein